MNICLKCVGEILLKDFIQQSGTDNQCSWCDEHAHCVEIERLAKEIQRVLVRDFQVSRSMPTWKEKRSLHNAEENWHPPGKMLTSLVAEIAGIEKRLSELIVVEMKKNAYEFEILGPVGHVYSGTTHWEPRPRSETGEDKAWDDFCESLKHQSRYFSEERMQILKKIFGNLGRASRTVDERLIETYSPGARSLEIWRGRIAHSIGEVKALLKFPSRELGAPPKEKAQAGRMNAKGIRALYGALEWRTCIAELRAPVGSHVVLGKFGLIEDVNLLDLSQLGKGDTKTSRFSPMFEEDLAYSGFLSRLVDKMCAPVVAVEDTLDYLPTQIIAEYLATSEADSCDGVLFPSIQTAGTGTNIALFAHACGVEFKSSELDINREVVVDFLEGHPVTGDHDFVGFWRKEVISEEDKKGVVDEIRFGLNEVKNQEASTDTLKLSELKVVKIDNVEYSFVEYDQIRPYTIREDQFFDVKFGG